MTRPLYAELPAEFRAVLCSQFPDKRAPEDTNTGSSSGRSPRSHQRAAASTDSYPAADYDRTGSAEGARARRRVATAALDTTLAEVIIPAYPPTPAHWFYVSSSSSPTSVFILC